MGRKRRQIVRPVDDAAAAKQERREPRVPIFEEYGFSRRIQRWLTDTDISGLVEPQVEQESEDLHDYRARLRPSVPVLTILDDGSRDFGEDHRLRSEVVTIGRTAGDVQLPNDRAISHVHAEIQRVATSNGHQWHLRDLGSRNGTFVRCQAGVLHDRAIVIIGRRGFRLRNPLCQPDASASSACTRPIDISQLPAAIWPTLEESTDQARAMTFPLKSPEVTIGRAGGGADIELDDPLLAHRHATLKRFRDGSWTVFAHKTRNGIWVSVSVVPLARCCYFRCGEQQFRFLIP